MKRTSRHPAKRTSRHAAKRTSRRAVGVHRCVVNSRGVCRTCAALMDSDRFHEHGIVANRRSSGQDLSKEFAMLEGIDIVRSAASPEQLSFIPPNMLALLESMAPGVYGFGIEESSVRNFPNASLTGAVTSTRIASQKSGGYHWLVDKTGRYPVVVRVFSPTGETLYRVEEYAAKRKGRRAA